jgi:hypothetical protein
LPLLIREGDRDYSRVLLIESFESIVKSWLRSASRRGWLRDDEPFEDVSRAGADDNGLTVSHPLPTRLKISILVPCIDLLGRRRRLLSLLLLLLLLLFRFEAKSETIA